MEEIVTRRGQIMPESVVDESVSNARDSTAESSLLAETEPNSIVQDAQKVQTETGISLAADEKSVPDKPAISPIAVVADVSFFQVKNYL